MIVFTNFKKSGDFVFLEVAADKGANVAAIVKKGSEEFVYLEDKTDSKSGAVPYKSQDRRIIKIGNKFSLLIEKPDKIEFLSEHDNVRESREIDLEDAETIEEIMEVMGNVKNVFLMFNCNIDAIKHIENMKYDKKIKYDFIPKKLEKEDDLFAGILYSMSRGEPLELAMNENVEKWLIKNIKPDSMRMGGQAGIMSNFLSSLDIRTTVYTPLLSKEQCSMFKDNIYLLTKNGLKPAKYAASDDPKKINWIFEYNEGDRLAGVRAKEHNRFIAASRPQKFRIDEFIVEKMPEMIENANCIIVSGFQGIKEKYNDGMTREEQFATVEKVLKMIWKSDRPMHLELTSIKDEKLRAQILRLGKYMDSIGLDEAELADALETFGEGKLAEDLRKDYDIIKLYEGVRKVLKKTGAKKIHLHDEGCFIAVCHKDYHVAPEEIKKSMIFSTVAVAAVASGDFNSKIDIWRGLTVEKTESGIEKGKKLEKYLKGKGIEMKDGIAINKDEVVVFVPNRIAHRVRDVVGLGDVISASIFVAENGYRMGDK